MQTIKSLFSRTQNQAAGMPASLPATQPTELSTDSLKLVGGGLPRIGGLGTSSAVPETTTAGATLPSVG